MRRFLYVKDGAVVNVVAYEDDVTPEKVGPDGEDVVLDPTGATNVGDAFDQNPLKVDGQVGNDVLFAELLRLSNAVRLLQIPPQAAMSAEEYREFLATKVK